MKELNQQEYSEYIFKDFQDNFPEFLDCYRFETDELIVEYPSHNESLTLWISTQDCELTVGFDQTGQCVWHTHMSLFGAYEPEDELREAVKFIKGIFAGTQKIVSNSKNEIYVTDTPEEIDETENQVEIRTWNDF